MIGTTSARHLEGVRFETRYLAAGIAPDVHPGSLLAETVPAPAAMTPLVANERVRQAVDRHLGLVWRVARRAGLGREDAEDAAQHAFFILSQRLKDVPKRAESSFLAATVLRVAHDMRQRKWNTAVDGGFDADQRAGNESSPEEEVDRQRALSLLNERLKALDEPERMVFILIEIEQLSRSEAAEILNVPEGTVASRLRKGRAEIEAAFARAYKPPRTVR